MDLLETAISTGEKPDLDALIAAIPYAQFIGMKVEKRGSELTALLPFSHDIIGNPMLPALHGGVIGAFLETTAMMQLIDISEGIYLPKTIDLTIDYLRSGKPKDTFARARVTKHGRRVANVHVEAWQDDKEKPIAAAHGHFLLKPNQEDDA